MLARLGDVIYRRAWLILAAGILFMVLGGFYGPGVFGELKNGGFADPASEATQAQEALRDHLGRPAGSLVVLFTAPDGSTLTVDSPEYRAAVETTLGRLTGQEGVESVASFYMVGAPQLVSNDRRSTFAAIGIRGDEGEQEEHFNHLRPLLTSDTLQVRVGGSVAVGAKMSAQVERDLARAETFTFPILAILLLIVFGSAVAAGLPLLTGAIGILGGFLIVRLIANVTDVSIFAVNIITILGLGLGVDYSLFMVSRFREELARQEGDVAAALRRTMQTAGRTVIFSGLTSALSLLGLLVFPFMFLRSMGLGAAAAVLVAMVTSITLLPAILALLGHRINALSPPASSAARAIPQSAIRSRHRFLVPHRPLRDAPSRHGADRHPGTAAPGRVALPARRVRHPRLPQPAGGEGEPDRQRGIGARLPAQRDDPDRDSRPREWCGDRPGEHRRALRLHPPTRGGAGRAPGG